MTWVLLTVALQLRSQVVPTQPLTSNNVVEFSWPTLSNANSVSISESTNWPYNQTLINMESATNIAVTNFPLGELFYYQIE